MSFHDLSRPDVSARQRLVEATGSPFAPGPATKPVVDVLDGRATHDAIEPADWLRALEATDGLVAVYFEVACDHEWWLAYDADGESEDDLDGPFHQWTTYPTGPWSHTTQSRGMLQQVLEDLYWVHDPAAGEDCDIYRSRVVRIEDAPRFVREAVGGDSP